MCVLLLSSTTGPSVLQYMFKPFFCLHTPDLNRKVIKRILKHLIAAEEVMPSFESDVLEEKHI